MRRLGRRHPGVCGWLRDDRGSLAPMMPVLAVMILLLGGLVLDASRQLNLRGRALAVAEEAARAGAGAIDEASTGLRLDVLGVERRVEDYCRTARETGVVDSCELIGVEQVRVGGTDSGQVRRLGVRVRVVMSTPATLLGMVGVRELQATGEALARPYEGVNATDVDTEIDPDSFPLPIPIDPGPEIIEGPEPPPLCDPLSPADPCLDVEDVCGLPGAGDPCLPPCPGSSTGSPQNPCAPPCPTDPDADLPVPCVPVEPDPPEDEPEPEPSPTDGATTGADGARAP